jgi:catechol 2,3-dioxygenase-like lactoylglutathione lyase family enzyme
MQLRYAIKYVADMDRAVAFHRDTLGLTLKFASPFWSEFDTGGTTLALHAASDDHPAGQVQLGFGVDDLASFYAAREEKGLTFTAPPENRFGATVSRFLDSEGAENSISG